MKSGPGGRYEAFRAAARDLLLEPLAVVVGHRQVELAVWRLVNLVDGANVGMVGCRGGPVACQLEVTSVGRHEAPEFLEPIQHHADRDRRGRRIAFDQDEAA